MTDKTYFIRYNCLIVSRVEKQKQIMKYTVNRNYLLKRANIFRKLGTKNKNIFGKQKILLQNVRFISWICDGIFLFTCFFGMTGKLTKYRYFKFVINNIKMTSNEEDTSHIRHAS
jgi:hypothetical protein